jgi:hypothetical protein
VLEAYRNRLGEHKKRFSARRAKLKAEMAKPFELTRPTSAYAGRFQNADLGTLTIAADGRRLNVTFGECELEVTPAGPDAVKVLGPTAEGLVFKFDVSKEGEVPAISLNVPGEGTLLFKRSDR